MTEDSSKQTTPVVLVDETVPELLPVHIGGWLWRVIVVNLSHVDGCP